VAIARKIIKVNVERHHQYGALPGQHVDLETLLVQRMVSKRIKQMIKYNMLDSAILAAKSKQPAKAKST
jgi:hypothetical protein